MNSLNKNKVGFFALGIIAVIGLQLSGCTQEREYEEVFKVDVHEKGVIDQNAEYMYVPSVQDTPRKGSASRPHWMGEGKIVKLKLAENSLDVHAMEQDGRYAENKLNNKPVLSIPVKHVDYRCAENANGECSNKEEENTETVWYQRKYFKPDFNSTKIQETNFLPIQISNLLYGCYNEIASNVIGYEMTSDTVNIEMEKTYKTSLDCIGSDQGLEDLTFSVKYFYSMVKVDKLVSPGYQKVEYPKLDSNTFGFFTTEQVSLSQDNRDDADGEKVLLNRWNPHRNVVKYTLTDNFNKAKFSGVKAATYEAIRQINNGLAKAGTPLKIELNEPSSANPGDLRKNMIVMVEDPLSTGLIGYGPSIANPKTGEIIHARTVMYLGNIIAFIRSAYNDIVEEKLKSAASPQGVEFNLNALEKLAAKETLPKIKLSKMPPTESESLGASNQLKDSSMSSSGQIKGLGLIDGGSLIKGQLESKIMNPHAQVQKMSDLKSELEFFSANNAYHGEMFNFDLAVSQGLKEQLGDLPTKPWAELTEEEKQKIIEKLLPYVWVPTLVHELGHNLGLRHNFNGSEDNENFYSNEELAGVDLTVAPEYSSVMDYAFKTTNELRVMGKYDVAALKFGYTRQVDVLIGKPGADSENPKQAQYKSVNVESTLSAMASTNSDFESLLKPYMYCTDEHVALNPGCNRFDEGTSLKEIVAHYADYYQDVYVRLNTRNGRRNFSMFNEDGYIGFINRTLNQIRLVFDAGERITEEFGIPFDPEKWEQPPLKDQLSEADKKFLLEFKEARDIGAQLLVDILMTPDAQCLLALETDPTSPIGLQPLSDISMSIPSCYSPELTKVVDRVNQGRRAAGQPGFVIAGQVGKSFRTLKDPSSTNAYADQIDVRGVWMDKLLAAETLLKRKHGISTLDKHQTNYFHDSVYAPVIKSIFEAIMLDEVVSSAAVYGPDGRVLRNAAGDIIELPIKHSMNATHVIDAPLLKSVARRLGLPEDQKTDFRAELIANASRFLPDRFHNGVINSFLDSFSVYTTIPNDGHTPADFVKIDLDGTRYMAAPENTMALTLIDHILASRVLVPAGPVKVSAALQYLACQESNNSADAKEKEDEKDKCEASDEVKQLSKAVKSLNVAVLQKFLTGDLKSESEYSLSLSALAESE